MIQTPVSKHSNLKFQPIKIYNTSIGPYPSGVLPRLPSSNICVSPVTVRCLCLPVISVSTRIDTSMSFCSEEQISYTRPRPLDEMSWVNSAIQCSNKINYSKTNFTCSIDMNRLETPDLLYTSCYLGYQHFNSCRNTAHRIKTFLYSHTTENNC